jgi:hypothetical protein
MPTKLPTPSSADKLHINPLEQSTLHDDQQDADWEVEELGGEPNCGEAIKANTRQELSREFSA